MVLIQLLLPTSGAASVDGLAPLAETRRELADRFNGRHGVCPITSKGMVDGSWRPHGTGQRRHGGSRDGHVRPGMVATYAATLAERFRQESIHLRALPVELLDEGNR